MQVFNWIVKCVRISRKSAKQFCVKSTNYRIYDSGTLNLTLVTFNGAAAWPDWRKRSPAGAA